MRKATKIRLLCALALACLVGIFGVIALVSNPFKKSSAADELQPLHEITVNDVNGFATNWNNALGESKNNVKITLQNDIFAGVNGVFGTGAGFTETGSILVPTGVRLQIELNGYQLDKGNNLNDEGSVIVNRGTLIITDSGNPQNHYVGSDGSIDVKGGVISGGNTRGDGGAILNYGNLEINGGILAGNIALGNGGAIAAAAGSVTKVNGGVFMHNSANATDIVNGGGAVALLGQNASLVVEDGKFVNNQANAYGGAIFAVAGSTIQIKNIALADNNAVYGGALASAAKTTIQRAAVARNSATLAGGAVYVFGGELTVDVAAFENNKAQQDAANNGEGEGGGAIAVRDGTLILNGVRKQTNQSNITFVSNTARIGAAISNNGGKVEAKGIVLAKNTATHHAAEGYGAGVANLAGVSNYSDSYFMPGTAKTMGRSIYVSGGSMNIIGGIIENHDTAVAAIGSANENPADAVLNFTGDVTLQYNKVLVDSCNDVGGTVTFNGANVQYNGYASQAEATGSTGTAPAYIIGSSNKPLVVKIYKINAQNNRASRAFAAATGAWVVGNESGADTDVVFTTNNAGLVMAIGEYDGRIYHGTFTNTISTTGVSLIETGAKGTLQISGGKFTGNNTRDSLIYANGAVTITGGTFTNNTNQSTQTQKHAGVLFVADGANAKITAGTFTGNKTNQGLGGVVYVAEKGQLSITGGEFTGNKSHASAAAASMDGGAIYALGAVSLAGNPKIIDNTAGTTNVKFNLYSKNPIVISGQITGSAGSIGVANKGQITTGYSLYNSIVPKQFFVSDHTNFVIERVDGEAVAVVQGASVGNYANIPAKVEGLTYNGTAQVIINGYYSEKMQVSGIEYTPYRAGTVSDLGESEPEYKGNNLTSFLRGETHQLIATNAGQYKITFELKSSDYYWLEGEDTHQKVVSITVEIGKKVVSVDAVQYREYEYTGSQLTAIMNYKPAVTAEQRGWLQGWKVEHHQNGVDESGMFGLRYATDVTAAAGDVYVADCTPEYVGDAGKNYYINPFKVYFRIPNRVNIDTDQFITVEFASVQYNNGENVEPSFVIFYRGISLGKWENNEWKEGKLVNGVWQDYDDESNQRPFGPFQITNVKFANNTLPSSETNIPTVTFTVNTGYMQDDNCKVMNFIGTTTRSFTINGLRVGDDEEEGEGEASVGRLEGKPIVTEVKQYDGTTSVKVVWRDQVKLVDGDGTLILYDIVAAYDSPNVGKRTITVTYIFAGENAKYYSYSYAINDCEITAIVINSVTGLTAEKVYDSETTAKDYLNTSGAVFAGKLAGDELGITIENITYATAAAGTNKVMSYKREDVKLTGFHSGNYTLAPNADIQIDATITPAQFKSVTVTPTTGEYDGIAHDVIKSKDVVLSDAATLDDEASIKWQYSLGNDIWENNVPKVTKASNITVKYRVSANNHETVEGEVQFALTAVDINAEKIQLNVVMGEPEVTYNGKEQNLIPIVTAKLDGKPISLVHGEDFRVEYVNSYKGVGTKEDEYENGFGDTKNVGIVTVSVIGLGSSFVGKATKTTEFEIKPLVIDIPAADPTSFTYTGFEQEYYIAPSEFYTVKGNKQSALTTQEDGTNKPHDVIVALKDTHNTIWSDNTTDDKHYEFSIYKSELIFSYTWKSDYFYVGKTYAADDVIIKKAMTNGDNVEITEGTLEFVTIDGKLTITDPDNQYFLTPNKIFKTVVDVKFTPKDKNFAPVTTTLEINSKWIEIVYNTNIGSGSAIVSNTFMFGDKVVFKDGDSGSNKVSRPYYTHVGWVKGAPIDPLSRRGKDDEEFARMLTQSGVVALNGETTAAEDATYYAVWCYVDYEIKLHIDNPTQYTTFEDDEGVPVEMYWMEASQEQFVAKYNGSIKFDSATNTYTYLLNHKEWTSKSGNIFLNTDNIQWQEGTGFTFSHWEDESGARLTYIKSLGNMDLHAKWKGTEYTVRFFSEGKELRTGKITNGEPLDANYVPPVSRDNYFFAGWFLEESQADNVDEYGEVRVIVGETRIWTNEDINLYAAWTLKQIELRLEQTAGYSISVTDASTAENSDGKEKTYNNGDFLVPPMTLKVIITKLIDNGYDYQGTYVEMPGVAGVVSRMYDSDRRSFEYELQDIAKPDDVVRLIIRGVSVATPYSITYDRSEASGVWEFVDGYTAPNSFNIENHVTLPKNTDVSRPGWTLVGWFLNPEEPEYITSTTQLKNADLKNLVLYPQWSANRQTITLYNGGKAYSTVESKTDDDFTLTMAGLETAGFGDYRFLGWSETPDFTNLTDDKILKVDATYKVKSANNNLYAVWEFVTEGMSLTISTDKTRGQYNFGETVMTITPDFKFTFANPRNGAKLTYTYYLNGEMYTGDKNGALRITDVAQSGEYTCVLILTDNGYARPTPLNATNKVTVEVLTKSIDAGDALEFTMLPNQTYTGEALQPEIKTISLEGHTLYLNKDFTITYDPKTNVNANDYARVTIEGMGNYAGQVSKVAFYIDPAEMTASARGYTGEYDKILHDAVLGREASQQDVTWKYSRYGDVYSAEMIQFDHAGEYTVYYRVEKPNYKTVEGTVTVTISAKKVMVEWTIKDEAGKSLEYFTYDANPHAPKASVDTGLGETLELEVEGAVAAGKHYAKATIKNTDYTDYELVNATFEFTIVAKKITVEFTNLEEVTDLIQRENQDEAFVYLEAKLVGLESADEGKVDFTIVYTYADKDRTPYDGKPTTTGNYYATVVLVNNTNYQLTGVITAPFVIRNEDTTYQNFITISVDGWTYGEEHEFKKGWYKSFAPLRDTDTEESGDITIEYFRWVNGQWQPISKDEVMSKTLAAGRYMVRVKISAVVLEDSEKQDDNYARTYAEAEQEFVVAQRELKLNWSDLHFTYNGTQRLPSLEFGNLLGNDECTFELDIVNGNGIDVGNYTVRVTNLSNPNYALPGVATIDIEIVRATLTIKIYDQTQIYNAPEADLTYDPDGTIYDTVSDVFTLTREPGNNVGEYKITGHSNNKNYTITFVAAAQDAQRSYGIYKITPQEVTLIWTPEYVYNGYEQQAVVKAIDKYAGEVFFDAEYFQASKRAVFKNVGVYQATAIENKNYTFLNNEKVVITINKADLYVKPNDLTVNYGEDFELTATFTGFVGDDDESVLLDGGYLEVGYRKNEDIKGNGDYTIKAINYNADNYNIHAEFGTLHVNGITLKILIKDLTSEYGDGILDLQFEFLVGSVLNWNDVFTLERDNSDDLSVGEYAIRGYIANRNYSITFVNERGLEAPAVYKITPRKITVQIQDVSVIYHDKEVNLSAKVVSEKGLVTSSDNADGSVYTLKRDPGDTVGQYAIRGTSTNDNYVVTFVSTVANRDYGIYRIDYKEVAKPEKDTTTYQYNGQDKTYKTNGTNWSLYREFFTLEGSAINAAGEPKQRNAGNYQIIIKLDPNCVWKDAAMGQEHNDLIYDFVIQKARYDDYNSSPDFTPYQDKTYDGKEHPALTIRTPINNTQFNWEFSTDNGKTYSRDVPMFKKAGTFTINYKIVSQNFTDKTGVFQVMIKKAVLSVVIGENTVEKGKKPALKNFEVRGLADGDDMYDVVRLVFLGKEYSSSASSVGDVFALTAALNDEYVDCYEFGLIKNGTLTVVEAKFNPVPIIIAVAGGVVLIGGGLTVFILMKKRKKKAAK